MKRRNRIQLLVVALCGSLLFTSCIGSFKLTNKLLTWNHSINTKFVNELVFIAFWIIPVYEVSALADILVVNSIEFWSGENPVADVGTVKEVETKDGIYTVETKADGYHIEKQDGQNQVDLVFNKADKSWNLETNGEETKLLQFTEDGNEVVMYLPDGKEMNVTLDEAGVLAFRQVVDNISYYAAR